MKFIVKMGRKKTPCTLEQREINGVLKYVRNCPKCNKELFDKCRSASVKAEKRNRPCHSCSTLKSSVRRLPIQSNIEQREINGKLKYVRNCPKCSKELFVVTRAEVIMAEKIKRLCSSCIQKNITKSDRLNTENIFLFNGKWSRHCSGCGMLRSYYNKTEAASAENQKRKCPVCNQIGIPKPAGKDNGRVKKLLKKLNISYEEYENTYRKSMQWYRNKVADLSLKQPIHLLENYEKRGKYKNNGYHLDHIYPVSIAFIEKWPPEKTAHISNLQYLHWKENIKKGNKIQT